MADGSRVHAHDGVDRARVSLAPSVVSFFCGCGGLDLGFVGGFQVLGRVFPKTGFSIKAAYDSDAQSIATYTQNLGPHGHVEDLSKVDVALIPPAQVLIGGFPCQEFSNCGPRKGLASERGSLYLAMVRYARLHRPAIVVGENVAGLLTVNGGADLKQIKFDFAQIGYRCIVWEMKAERFGVPQARHRIFLLLVRDDINVDPLMPDYECSTVPVSVESAIADLLQRNMRRAPNQGQYFKAARAGRGHGQGDERSPRDGPGYTVRANSRSRVQFHYSRPRRLTVRECARLQTFPDSFVFPFAATTNMRQIGNAVPPVLAHKVATKIMDFIALVEQGR